MLMMAFIFLMVGCAVMAIRARRLLTSALWLAGVSGVLALLLYTLGASQVGAIELSVGAGLVTILLVFAINLTGDEAVEGKPVVPRVLAWSLGLLPVVVLGAMLLPAMGIPVAARSADFVNALWQSRALDVMVQVVLLFAGVLGLLGLLAEAEAPLGGSAAREVAARRERELSALEKRAERHEVKT